MKLNMHRVADGRESDWEGMDYDDMNKYQKRAFDTNGFDTPGNRVTFGRVVLAAASLIAIKRGYKKTGFVGLGVSLLGDWVDGHRAEQTGTKMTRNGNLDAIADMAIRAAALPVLASEGIITKRYAAALAVQNGTISAATMINTAMGHNPKSNAAGKIKTVIEGVSLVTAGINNIQEGHESTVLLQLERTSKAAAVLGNAAAAAGYISEIFRPDPLALPVNVGDHQ
ncbi:MAG: CDP-alcohol phosphatidyltransferase family protein [Candidatus Saccharibacteria bacterium]